MKKLRYFVALLVVTLLAGCTNSTSSSSYKDVKDDAIRNLLTNYVIAIESSPKTIELYKKDKATIKDYKNEDMLLIGLNTAYGLESEIDLTPAQVAHFEKNNMKNVYSYINSSDVESNINKIFGSTTVKNATTNSCPNYIFNQQQSVYYVQHNCENKDKILSYISSVKNDGNLYLVEVYAGYISNNTLYGDVNKSKKIKDLEVEESYTIDDSNKGSFTKYTYTFKKNSDGNYIFDSFTK